MMPPDDNILYDIYHLCQAFRDDQKYLVQKDGFTLLLATSVDELHEDIEAVDLCQQGLKSFPEEVFICTKLKVLLLYGNEIRKLPSSIGQLSE